MVFMRVLQSMHADPCRAKDATSPKGKRIKRGKGEKLCAREAQQQTQAQETGAEGVEGGLLTVHGPNLSGAAAGMSNG